MSINFYREYKETSFLDPQNDFQEKTLTSEVRYDPLTGDISRVFPFRRLIAREHDWQPFVEESQKQFCPFCPENLDKATPRFLKEFCADGHIRAGNAVAVPNLNPYEKHTAVVVMCPEHYVAMPDIYSTMVVDGFRAALEYLKRAREYDPEGAQYCSVNWNYMPYAGGSIIHPHLQVLAGPRPCTFDERMYLAAQKFSENTGRNYFTELIEAEKKEEERYLGRTGDIHWMSTFAPRHVADITGVLPGKADIYDLTGEDLEQLAGGMVKIARYYHSIKLPSFNAGLYFGLPGDNSFTVTVRMVGRFTIFPIAGSDITHMQVLHDDPWTVLLPEKIAEDLGREFG